MKTFISCTVALLMMATTSFSQTFTQTVKGQIVDTDTKMPLIGATVFLMDSDPMVGTTTDLDGYFRLEKIPVGRKSFRISYIGYEDVFRNEVVIGSGREVVLNLEMKESVVDLQELTVVASADKQNPLNSMATISAQQITVESTSRIAAGINDPGRTAQSFAGVATADDENNELVVRGNSPRGVLWRLEGVPIPNPNHFSNGEGGSGGGVSALSTQVLANSDFFTGAFPAEYGNALSGVFDLKLRNGNHEQSEYALQLGVLGAQVAAEGPLVKGKKASYLFNYRYSSLKLLSYAGIDISGGDIVPDFQDLSFKLNLPTKNSGRFAIWGLGGLSSAGYTALQDSTQWVYAGHRKSETEKHKLGILGATHNYILKNGKSYIKTVAALSVTDNQLFQDSLGAAYEKNLLHHEQFQHQTASVNSFFNHKFNSKNIIRTGLTFTQQGFDLAAKRRNYERQAIEPLIANEGHTNMLETYFQWQYRPNTQLKMNLGFHSTYFGINGDLLLEPRIGLDWKVSEKGSVSMGAGLHSRAEPASIYLVEVIGEDDITYTPNEDLGLTRAFHAVVGYNWNVAPNFKIKTEAYYQHLFDVPVQIDDPTGTISALNFSSGYVNEPLSNDGKGRNYGVEMTIQKFFSQDYYFLVTGSLFESRYTMPGQEERNTAFNSKFVSNLLGGKEFKVGANKQNVLGLNVRTIWRGGYRVVPVDLEASMLEGNEVRLYDRAFEEKVPNYFRVDLGISYRKNSPNRSWVLSLDLQNATNRYNVYDRNFSYETGNLEETSMLGLIPILNYRVEW